MIHGSAATAVTSALVGLDLRTVLATAPAELATATREAGDRDARIGPGTGLGMSPFHHGPGPEARSAGPTW